MSGQKIIDGLNDALAGNVARETTIQVDHSPETIVHSVLASEPDPTTAKATRALAHKVTKALRAHGWRILR